MKTLYSCAAAIVFFTATIPGVGSGSRPAHWRVANFENILGTSMELRLDAESETAAARAEAAAMGEIRRLAGILSGYDPESEFSRWAVTRDRVVPVSSDLMDVLGLWDSWRARSNGALNPAAEAIVRVWKNAELAGKLPDEAEMSAAVSAAQQQHWSLDETLGSATRLTSAPLILNSFTKSYIIERAAQAALREAGVHAVVLNIGGDMVVRGASSDVVSVADPRSDAENSRPLSILRIRDHGVASSGNYRRGFDIGGEHYSHIVDPRTGRTAEGVIGATVVAPDAVDAGALATAFCVLAPEKSRKLAASVPGVQYLLMLKGGAQIRSAGWSALEASPMQNVAAAIPQGRADASLWNTAFELTINVELPQPQGFGARRPYVAVWIEDKDRFPIRTLAVWFKKERWLDELRAWYRDDRMRATAGGADVLSSVTSATRSPGKYAFKWDGKDNNGKLVKAGRYTVLVEAAREHGGYSLDRREMNFNGEPAQIQLPRDVELGAVSFDYHKVAR
jgi:thiamine biosynthesis lipoprotein